MRHQSSTGPGRIIARRCACSPIARSQPRIPATPAAGPAFIADAERLIALNPRDNHGVRDDLTRAYIAAGQPERALALADAYPDDFCTLALNRILALHRLGRLDDAQRALDAARKRHRVAIEMLLADKPSRPRPSAGYGITVGGKEEAWEYRAGHRALWETGDALTWLRQAWKGGRASLLQGPE